MAKEYNESDYDIPDDPVSLSGNYSDYSSMGGQEFTDTPDLLNAKIISSDNKDKKIVLSVPKHKLVKMGLPLLDKGKIVYSNGVPVLKKIKNVYVFDGFEEKEVSFPLTDWFNDSVTSGFMSKDEIRYIRSLDAVAFRKWCEMILNPKVDHTHFINFCGWEKSSFADGSKGTEGEAAKLAKTIYSKGENLQRTYEERIELDKYRDKKGKGLLGLGIWRL